MPVRRDLFGDDQVAHSDLKGQVEARAFADGALMRVATPVADLRLDPARDRLDRQVLHGQPVRQLDKTRGLSRDETTGYVGYIPPNHLSPWAEPTHRVTARATLLFTQPDFKDPNPVTLSCGSLLSITDIDGKFVRTHDGRFALPRT